MQHGRSLEVDIEYPETQHPSVANLDVSASSTFHTQVTMTFERDKDGETPLPSLLRVFEVIRGHAGLEHDVFHLGSLFHTHPWIAANQSLSINRKLYDKLINPQSQVLIITTLKSIGRYTLLLEAHMVHNNSGLVVCTNRLNAITTQFLPIAEGDTKLRRRAVPVPEWFVEKNSNVPRQPDADRELEKRIKAQWIDLDHVIYTHTVIARPSDTDLNLHVNHASYINMLTDALYMATQHGASDPELQQRLCQVHIQDFTMKRISDIEIFYDGEAFAGDTLHVIFSCPKPNVVRLLVKRVGTDVGLCRAQFTLNESSPLSKPISNL